MGVEENIIISGKKTLEKISNGTIDKDILINEYSRLLKAYKRLSKRYNKTNKMNDREQRNSLDKNESLEIDKKNIQTIAKSKIIKSIKTQRETQEHYNKKLSNDKVMMDKLKNKLDKVTGSYYSSLKKIDKLTKPKTVYKEDLSIKEIYHRNINLDKFKMLSYKKILKSEIENANKNQKDFVAIKLTVDGMIDSLKVQGETSTNILSAILKSINGSLKNQDVIYFIYPNIFYILIVDRTIENSQSVFNVIMKPRQINKMNINFSLGITQFKMNIDTYDTIENRLSIANNEASYIGNKNSFIIKLD